MLLVSGIALGSGRPSLAWGPSGHRIITRIAEARLKAPARAAIRDLLHEGDDLVTESTWADHEGHDAVPGSASWHYVNVPITVAHYDARFCHGGNCVVDKIKHYRKILADTRAPRAERARALLFFVHFVEDVHQPLHVGDNRDRGGNNTQVQYFNVGGNLHRLWDSTMIDETSRSQQEWVDRIGPLLTPENVEAWSKGDVEAWTDESLQEAKKAYRFPPGTTSTVESGVRLGREYAEQAIPIIRLRMAQAGVRLANELNAVFP